MWFLQESETVLQRLGIGNGQNALGFRPKYEPKIARGAPEALRALLGPERRSQPIRAAFSSSAPSRFGATRGQFFKKFRHWRKRLTAPRNRPRTAGRQKPLAGHA